MLSVVVDVDGLYRKLDLAIDQTSEISLPLRKFGAHLRRAAVARYKAQDFPALAASTVAHRATKGLHSLEGKLQSDVRKAYRRQTSGRAPRGMLQRAMAALGAHQEIELGTASTRGVKNRLAVLAEFQRRHGSRGGQVTAGASPLTMKSLQSLGRREDRAVAKAVGKPILGGLYGTLEVEVGHGSVTLRSHTRLPWTDTHNKGGSAGHGAKIPQRETIKVTDADVDLLVELLKDHIIAPFEPA